MRSSTTMWSWHTFSASASRPSGARRVAARSTERNGAQTAVASSGYFLARGSDARMSMLALDERLRIGAQRLRACRDCDGSASCRADDHLPCCLAAHSTNGGSSADADD